MPKPKEGESQKDFVSRCIPIVLDDGAADSQEQAAAICYQIYKDKDKKRSDAVKAVGDWEIEVRAVPFGVDKDQQTFDAQTDYMLGDFPTPAIVYHHGIKPGRSGFEDKPVIIGKTIKAEQRNDGIWLRVVLDKVNEYAQRVWEAAKSGFAVASSDSIAHLARLEVGGKRMPYDKRPGRIAVWPLAAVSLWDNNNFNLKPASSNALAMPAIKSIYEQAGIALPDISENDEPKAKEKAAKIARKNLQKQARTIIALWGNEE